MPPLVFPISRVGRSFRKISSIGASLGASRLAKVPLVVSMYHVRSLLLGGVRISLYSSGVIAWAYTALELARSQS